MIHIFVIVMYIKLRIHNFFKAEQWQGDQKQKPMRYRQRGMVRVLLIAVQIIQKLTYCIVIRCVITNCKYKMITIVSNCLTFDTVATVYGYYLCIIRS